MTLSRPIRTLEDFRDTGRAIHAYCSHYYACSHDAPLPLVALQRDREASLVNEIPWGGKRKGGRRFGR